MTQERCCCICDETYRNIAGNLQRPVKPRVRALPGDKKTLLQACILGQLKKLDDSIKAKEVIRLFDCRSPNNKDLADKIMEGLLSLLRLQLIFLVPMAFGMKFALHRLFL